MKKVLFVLAFISCTYFSNAQFFTGAGGTIPDNSAAVYFPVVVSGLSSNVIDSAFGVESVCVTITHNNDYQLTIQLVAPDNSVIDLSMYNGGSGNNYSGTCFNNNATTPITAGSPPFSGSYRSQGMLGNINNGQNGNGIWRLKVQDHNQGSTGSLSSWSITFSNSPALPFIYSSSDLPIVVINTFGQSIPDDPKINVHMGIIDNGFGNRNHLTDPFNSYNGNIGIELRGSWSQSFPQKQYGYETLDSLYIETDTTVLGMPSESDWILNAPWNDKTCMRNVLVYDIANKTGHYASRTRFCELVLNNEYKGIYIMLEKVKRDANRVDISKLTTADTSGNDLTGGYIVKIDKQTGSGAGLGWNSVYNGYQSTPILFQYEYPSWDEIMPQQSLYIESFMDSFERALASTWFLNVDSGYKKYVDLQSFVDYFILNETCKNVDAYRISTFLYKQKITKGGKLVIGPAWDYNIGFRNADYCEGDLYTGWQYQYNNICGTDGGENVPFWWGRMMQDPAFTSLLKCRWQDLRLTTLNTDTLLNEVDSLANIINEAKDRHFYVWPILGLQTWANPSPIPADFAGEISSMKTWITQRLSWLDLNMPGNCVVADVESTHINSVAVKVFPNPATDLLNVSFETSENYAVTVSLKDISGREVMSPVYDVISSYHHIITLNIKNIKSGVYFLTVDGKAGSQVMKVVHQ
ncbi:MAG: CotH kinase family protein [Bacteroidota bacterium]